MARFYIDQTLNPGSEIALPGNIIQHLNVLRLKSTQAITLFNGNGKSYTAKIISLERRNCLVTIEKQDLLPSTNKIKLNLALSIIAGDKMDLAIRSATELGITTITPIISSYSQKLASNRLENRMEHWQKVILSGCEQSGQNIIPSIVAPVSFQDFVTTSQGGKFILSLSEGETMFHNKQFQAFENINLLIGPEGGFTVNEVSLAIDSGYIAIRPWNNILRAETAVIAGISLILNNLH